MEPVALGRALFIHFRNDNIGDYWSCPEHYYDFRALGFDEIETKRVRERPHENETHADMLVLGGGLMSRYARRIGAIARTQFRASAIWGVGMPKGKHEPALHRELFEYYDCIGSRESYHKGHFDFVPCASCKSPLFDLAYEETHELVVYLHAGKTTETMHVPEEIPISTNYFGTLEAAIAFIASGRTVVTNSYHGTYWAMLFGKNVLCLPFSRKFHGFEKMPGLSTQANWQRDLHKAVAFDGHELLARYRGYNDAFCEKVLTRAQEKATKR